MTPAAYPRVSIIAASCAMKVACAQRAGPALPSYLALHHAGFSVPRLSPNERWALTPPFHPCLQNQRFEGLLQVSLLDATVLDFTGGLFSVALSVSQRLRGSSPGVTRRVAHRFPTLPPETSVSGLSSRPCLSVRTSDRPAHPLDLIIPNVSLVPDLDGRKANIRELGASVRTSS